MIRLHVGASLERMPGKGYAKRLSFAELAPRAPRPRPATLGRWARDLPEGFTTALVLPVDACAGPEGWLALGEDEDAIFTWIEEATKALKPAAVVVTTGRELTPGKRDRDRLTRYFGRLKTPGAHRVWSPAGLWEGEALERMAQKLDVLPAIDPLSAPPQPAQTLYARVRGLGERSRIGEGLRLLELAEQEGLIPSRADDEENSDAG